MPLEDNELMRRVAEQNDTYAFEKLVLRCRAPAVAFAVRYAQDHFLAEDLAQEAFARLYLKRYQFRTDSSFRAYFYRILRNVCIDHYRQHSRTTEVELHTSQIVQHNTPETIAISQLMLRNRNEAVPKIMGQPHFTVLLFLSFHGAFATALRTVLDAQTRLLLVATFAADVLRHRHPPFTIHFSQNVL